MFGHAFDYSRKRVQGSESLKIWEDVYHAGVFITAIYYYFSNIFITYFNVVKVRHIMNLFVLNLITLCRCVSLVPSLKHHEYFARTLCQWSCPPVLGPVKLCKTVTINFVSDSVLHCFGVKWCMYMLIGFRRLLVSKMEYIDVKICCLQVFIGF